MDHSQAQQIKRAFSILDSSSGKSGSIAPGASEILIVEPTKAEFWNYLEAYNRSGAAIEIQLDGQTTGAKIKQLFQAALMVIDPDDGLRWNTITIKNLDALTTINADEVTLVSNATQQVRDITVR